MTTVNYAFDPGALVYYVDTITGVNPATVVVVSIIGTTLEVNTFYQILFTHSDEMKYNVSESDLFVDVDLALAEYKLRHLS